MGETTVEQDYVLAKLACGCVVMQRKKDNPGLFFLLTHQLERGITLWCADKEHRRQIVERLITRTQKRPHWPLLGSMKCGSCQTEIAVPPAAAETDEQTMNGDGVYVRCPNCKRWGNYGYAGSGEDYYDRQTIKVECPNCKRDTIVRYDPFETPVGVPVGPYTCMNCRQHFHLTYQKKQQ